MNADWKRGIYRLWVGLAVVWWIAGAIWGIVQQFQPDEIILYLSIWILPPLVIAGFWKGVVWIKKGFEADKPPIIEDKEDTKE